jgi:hypothetical protein
MWRQTLGWSCSHLCCVYCCYYFKICSLSNLIRPKISVDAFVPRHKGNNAWRNNVGFNIRMLTKLALVLLLTLLNGLHCCKLLIHNTALLEQIFFRFLIFQTPYAETMAHVPSLCSLLALISLSEKVYNKVKYIYHPFKFNWISSPFSFSSITFSFTLSLYVYVRMKLYLASLAVKICPAIKTLGIDGMNFHIVLRLMSRVLIYFRCLMSSQSCFLSFIVLSGNMIPSTFRINNTDVMDSLATNVLVSQRLFNFEQIILLFPFM